MKNMGVYSSLGFFIFMWVLYSYFASSFAALDGAATATFHLVETVAETSSAQLIQAIEE